ncbi:hypothetical protein CHCC20333_3242 [Bacillus paralicheniformis]|nr:hypothetical protein CHCC20333_3242 [Bacillus paralicheniformis]
MPKLATAPLQLFCDLKTIKSGHLKSSANDEFSSASLLLALVLLSLTA